MIKSYLIMIKKTILCSALTSLMILSSCGYSRDGIIDDIAECESAEDLRELIKSFNNSDFREWIIKQPEEDVMKISNAAGAKTGCFWILEGTSAKDLLSSELNDYQSHLY